MLLGITQLFSAGLRHYRPPSVGVAPLNAAQVKAAFRAHPAMYLVNEGLKHHRLTSVRAVTQSVVPWRLVVQPPTALKADKTVSLGNPVTSDQLTSRTDIEKKTAYGQGLTALANREADVAINVHFEDNAHKSIRDGGSLQLFPEQPAIVVLVDRVNGRWDALHAAYALARALCIAWDDGTARWDALDLVVKRMARELERLRTIDDQLDAVRKAAEGILKSLETITDTREGIRDSLDLMDRMVEALRDNPGDTLSKRAFLLEQ